jgi:hypothetical protein
MLIAGSYRGIKLAIVTAAVATMLGGCGSSSAQPKPTQLPTPRPTSGSPSHLGPIPQTSPPARPRGAKHVATTPAGTVGTLPAIKPPVIPTSTPIPTSAYTATIHGTISDAKTHSPLAGASISLGDGKHQTHSNAFGDYRLAFPGGVPEAVSVVMNGYLGSLAMGKVQPHRSLKLNFKLYPRVSGQAPAPPSLFGTQILPPTPKGH